ncbi:MAG: Druantia anti-phage system protein DruA [Pseudomonadota bacterium]
MTISEVMDRQGVLLRYRNREITTVDLEFLREQCASTWATRADLARSICSEWHWRQANGSLSLHACSDLLRRLDERGLLSFPAPKTLPRRKRKQFSNLPLPPDLIPLTGLEVRDPVDLHALCVRPILPEERLGWRLYVERYHYLRDRPIVGENLLYAAFMEGELVALIGWASAAFRAPLREVYVGWDEATKRHRLHFVANNIRFLILPWVHVRHLASKILATNLRRLSADWQTVWKHPVVLAETFVDTARFRGTCYRASNWLQLGETAGRSKHGNNYSYGGTRKALFVYPLCRHATRFLKEGT